MKNQLPTKELLFEKLKKSQMWNIEDELIKEGIDVFFSFKGRNQNELADVFSIANHLSKKYSIIQ